MSSTVVRREGDLVVLEHKYYGKFSFRDAPSAALADAAAASAEVFAGERTDGRVTQLLRPAHARKLAVCPAPAPAALLSASPPVRVRRQEPRRVALKFDTGNQVYNDHLRWRDLYYDEAARFAGLPWVHSQTIPEAPWRGGRADVMVSQLLGASLEAVRLRSPAARLLGGCAARLLGGCAPVRDADVSCALLRSARCRRARCAASPCRCWICSPPCTPRASCTATSSLQTCWHVAQGACISLSLCAYLTVCAHDFCTAAAAGGGAAAAAAHHRLRHRREDQRARRGAGPEPVRAPRARARVAHAFALRRARLAGMARRCTRTAARRCVSRCRFGTTWRRLATRCSCWRRGVCRGRSLRCKRCPRRSVSPLLMHTTWHLLCCC